MAIKDGNINSSMAGLLNNSKIHKSRRFWAYL